MKRYGVLCLLALAACRPKPTASASADASAEAAVPAPLPIVEPPVQRQLFGFGGAICFTDGKTSECGYPELTQALVVRPRPTMDRLIAASRHVPCWLRDDKTAFCRDQEIGKNVASVEGAPYLLQANGQVIVVPEKSRDGDEDTLETSMREEAVNAIFDAAGKGSIDRIVHADGVTCAKTKAGDVWCWAEPRQGFNDEVEGAAKPRPARVPGLHDIADIALMPWLTLCARTTAGAVSCSRPTGTADDVCELRGRTDVRCGNQRPGPDGPAPLIEPSYALRRMMNRPLEPVPGLDGTDAAATLALWTVDGWRMGESQRRTYLGRHDEGGCAKLTSGAVRCWERDRCAPKKPWRSAAVDGLPPDVERVVLGASDGYAVTSKGQLFHWARRSGETTKPHEDCKAPSPLELKAEAVALPAPVRDIYGRSVAYLRHPGAMDVDCVSLVNGELSCWYRDDHERKALPIDREYDAGDGWTQHD